MLNLICLDLDGCVVDWMGPVAKLVGKDLAKIMPEWPRGSRDYHTHLGVTKKELWSAIEGAGEKFWEDLPMLPWGADLYDLCCQMAPVIFATSSTLHASSASGKVKWMQKHFGRSFRDYLIGPRKECLAKTGTVLIDDTEKNIDSFNAAGGHGFLVSQPWNTGTTDFSLAQLEEFLLALKQNQD